MKIVKLCKSFVFLFFLNPPITHFQPRCPEKIQGEARKQAGWGWESFSVLFAEAEQRRAETLGGIAALRAAIS